jgi:cytochrome c-type biogenesis protein CcmH
MNNLAYFWAAAGFMAGIAAAFFVLRLWSASGVSAMSSVRGKALVVTVASVFAGLVFSIYAWIGTPEPINQAGGGGHATTVATQDNAAAGSMSEAAARLAAKLASDGGTDADWQLLQQSYEFIGDTEGADLAQQHQLKSAATQTVAATPVADSTALSSYRQRVARNPKDAAAWLAIAELQRTTRNFAEATAAFEQVIELKAMNAGAWADYADAAASVADSLANARTRSAIDAALKLEPQHSKALWLKASLAYEEHRYADALKLWRQLRAAIPDGSPDVSIIEANIQEAQLLAGNKVATAVAPVGNAATAQVRGSVTLDPTLKQNATTEMTLFVYAKSTDSSAPVAAYRTRVTSWPVNFVLDDALAMMPARKLSQFEQVKVEARLSRSGQALAQSGDLQAEPVTVATRSMQPVSLRISRLVP